jgi:hypothetical protein
MKIDVPSEHSSNNENRTNIEILQNQRVDIRLNNTNNIEAGRI